MPNQMATKFFGNSKILPFHGLKSEFNHSTASHSGKIIEELRGSLDDKLN